MKKISRLPHEQAAGVDDGLQDVDRAPSVDGDVEGHRVGREPFAPRLPGTGGDFRRPSGGGEATDEQDVEGHGVPSGDRLNRLPGTGGDFRRPSGGGEIDADDDVKGHVS